jgi:thymidine phosphorylase
VDKHSTGGVGDKTTLVIAPIVAACGVKIAKMSGRGLGHTGGTIDKMESVPGTRTALSQEEFFAQVNRIGLSVIGQSEGIAIADKKMYALRDVTATVSCIPLIASSIMSKKLASGSDAILLDVTTGTGAFMKTGRKSDETNLRIFRHFMDLDKGIGQQSDEIVRPRRMFIQVYRHTDRPPRAKSKHARFYLAGKKQTLRCWYLPKVCRYGPRKSG